MSFLNESSLDNYSFSKDSYLFSSYSLSELQNNIKKIYYDKLFTIVKYGFFVWNTDLVNLPKKYLIKNCEISAVGKFVYLI